MTHTSNDKNRGKFLLCFIKLNSFYQKNRYTKKLIFKKIAFQICLKINFKKNSKIAFLELIRTYTAQ